MAQDDAGNDLTARNTVAAQVAELIAGSSGDAVLEVGDAAALAGRDPGSLDALALTDVLGRVADPQATLREAAALLRDGGRLVVAVPHVAHGSVRLALLDGRWSPSGGTTHFTLDTLLDLLAAAGLVADVVRTTVADPLDAGDGADVDTAPLPWVVEWVRDQPGALDRDLVVAAHVGAADGVRPRVEPAAPYDAVRRRDRFSEAKEQEQQARHDLLVMQDHVIGLEAMTSAARVRASDARRRLQIATRKLQDERKERRNAPEPAASPAASRSLLGRLLGRGR